MPDKKLGSPDIIGQQGINFVEKICLAMGFLWRPTPLFDTGIDGTIEIRDSETGEVTNALLHVQVKSTTRSFLAESERSFEYVCSEKDLRYWLQGNAPVLLILARPDSDEAYWVAIKDYFNDPTKISSRRVQFDKQKDRFDIYCRQALVDIAISQELGVYFAPPLRNEVIYSNLLRVQSIHPKIYLAEAEFRDRKSVWRRLNDLAENAGSEWILKNKRILSFHDLTEYPWNQICDQGTAEYFDSEEWSLSDQEDQKREFVQLLNLCLKEKAKTLGLRFHNDEKLFYFGASRNLNQRKIKYKGVKQQTSRVVFEGYRNKKDRYKISYYRHSAFKGFFQRYDDAWYLEITPTYLFTRDGYRPDKYASEYLKGIKRLERNPAVLGQVVMWADYLSQTSSSLFEPEYHFLQFGDLVKFDVEVGIDDDEWLPNKQSESKVTNEPTFPGLDF